jgi:hypothetical protein
MGTAYFRVDVPVCETHEGMPGIMNQFQGDKPEPIELYDQDVNLFAACRSKT